MERAANVALWQDLRRRNAALEEEMEARAEAINAWYKEAIAKMESDCVGEHGAHEDDGAMFHGSCTRCGASLG